LPEFPYWSPDKTAELVLSHPRTWTAAGLHNLLLRCIRIDCFLQQSTLLDSRPHPVPNRSLTLTHATTSSLCGDSEIPASVCVSSWTGLRQRKHHSYGYPLAPSSTSKHLCLRSSDRYRKALYHSLRFLPPSQHTPAQCATVRYSPQVKNIRNLNVGTYRYTGRRD
jgi:hypothetical protein